MILNQEEIFDDGYICVKNPNFTITRTNFLKNLLNYTTNEINNENCIWFRNNGIMWHTLYTIEPGYKEMMINDKEIILSLPQLVIHVGKNKYSKYEIDIFFQDTNGNLDNVYESFLHVDNIDIDIGESNYVKESTLLINHILHEYNFQYDGSIDELYMMINQNNVFDNFPMIDIKLSDMIEIWKKEIDECINLNIIYNMVIKQRNDFTPMSYYIKKKIFMGVLYETMKHIKLGNKKYLIYGIDCYENIKDSINNNFKNDKILLYDLEQRKKVALPLKRIIESKFKMFENGHSIIPNSSIKIGNYIKYVNRGSDGPVAITPEKIINIRLDKDNYSLILETNRLKRNKEVITNNISYNLIEEPRNIDALDIYQLIGLKDNKEKFPIFKIKDSTIVSKKDNNQEKYYLNDICDFIGSHCFYNKIEDFYFDILSRKQFVDMLNILNKEIKTLKNNYYFGYIPNNKMLGKKLLKCDNLYIDDEAGVIHLQCDDEYFNKEIDDIKLTDHEADVVMLPCVINDVHIDPDEIYISHLKRFFNRRIRINGVRIENNELVYMFTTIDDMENHTNTIRDNYFCGKQIYIEGLQIGQYGKLKDIGASLGFKKSLWHGIKYFYENKNGEKMVLFENNIAVNVKLIDIDYFNNTSRNVKKRNMTFLSSNDLRSIRMSTKRKITDHILHTFDSIACEIHTN